MTEKTGDIYRIISPSHPELIYYGSTVKSLAQRLSGHKSEYKNRPHRKLDSYQIVQYDDAKIEFVEEVPLESLRERETWYIENYPCINRRKAYLDGTPQEKLNRWKKENPEKQKQHLKTYYEKHKGERVVCPVCKEEMLKQSLTRHTNRHH